MKSQQKIFLSVKNIALSGALILYVAGFTTLYRISGEATGALSLIPVALAGYFYGKKIGLVFGLGMLPVHIFLYSWVTGSETAALFPFIVPPTIVTILIGFFAGWLSELLHQSRMLARMYEEEHKLLTNEIEERQKIEQVLSVSENNYRSLVEDVTEIIFKTDSAGLWTFLNRSWTEMTGYTIEESLGTLFLNYIHPDDRERNSELFKPLIGGKKSYCRHEIRYIKKNGDYCWVEVYARLTFDQTGSTTGTAGTLMDITNRKESERLLRSMNEILEQKVFQRTVQLETDIGKRKKAEEELRERFTAEQIISKLSSKFIDVPVSHLDSEINYSLRVVGEFTDVDRAFVLQTSADRSRIGISYEWHKEHVDPTIISFQNVPVNAMPWLSKKIVDSEYIHIPSVSKLPPDASNEKELFNQKAVKSLLIIPLNFQRRITAALAFETVITEKEWSGKEIHFCTMISQVIASALTRNRIEAEMQSAQQRLHEVLAASNCFVYSCKPEKGFPFTFISENVKSILGYESREILFDRKLGTDNIHPDDRKLWFKQIRDLLKENESSVEYRLQHKDGTYHWLYDNIKLVRDPSGMPAEIVGTVVDITERKTAEQSLKDSEELYRLMFQSNPLPMWVYDIESLSILTVNDTAIIHYGYSREEFLKMSVKDIQVGNEDKLSDTHSGRESFQRSIECRHRKKNGTIIDIEIISYLMLFNGRKTRFVLITDVTEKKMMEKQLFRSQRMESIGTLAGGIAHDLNNILTPVMMWLEVLKEKLPDKKSQNILTLLESSTQRGSDMVRQVLTFARGVEGERIEIQPVHLLKEIKKIITESFPRSIDIMLDFPRDLWMITGDATQLHQVLLNLCVNARDAMSNGGKLNISCENVEVFEEYTHTHIDVKPGKFVLISVSDNGIGIPHQILDRIFDPFFTTKEVGKGTGLGLSTSHAIVKSHGGFINVYSEYGKGSVFKVYLPAVLVSNGVQKPSTHTTELPRGKGELIMVVDDETVIREVMKEILTRFGYTVIVASDGAEGISQYIQRQTEIKLVITDMMMPYMDGIATIRALRQINPTIKIIGTSGLASNETALEAMKLHIQGFVKKPFTSKGLLEILVNAMNNGDAKKGMEASNGEMKTEDIISSHHEQTF